MGGEVEGRSYHDTADGLKPAQLVQSEWLR